jgi:hypothetical protein
MGEPVDPQLKMGTGMQVNLEIMTTLFSKQHPEEVIRIHDWFPWGGSTCGLSMLAFAC